MSLFVMYIAMLFKFCQTHGTLHQWTSQIPWRYLGRIIHIMSRHLTHWLSQVCGFMSRKEIGNKHRQHWVPLFFVRSDSNGR